MKKTFLTTALMTMAGVCVLAVSAMADPYITGGIGMRGAWTPVLADGAITTIPLSEGIAFRGWSMNKAYNSFVETSETGSFLTIPTNSNDGKGVTTGAIQNFQFDTKAPIELWSVGGVGGFSFVMDTFTVTNKPSTESAPGNFIVLVDGLGTLSEEGFLDTRGEWNFTSQGADGANFAPVPEPATMLLFGAGLMGLAFVGRKIRE